MEGASADARLVVTDVSTVAVSGAAIAGMTEFARLLAISVGLLLLVECATVGMLLLIRTEASAARWRCV